MCAITGRPDPADKQGLLETLDQMERLLDVAERAASLTDRAEIQQAVQLGLDRIRLHLPPTVGGAPQSPRAAAGSRLGASRAAAA